MNRKVFIRLQHGKGINAMTKRGAGKRPKEHTYYNLSQSSSDRLARMFALLHHNEMTLDFMPTGETLLSGVFNRRVYENAE